jgi:hypothetical protein
MERLPDRLPERTPDRGCAYRGNPGRPSAATKRAWIEATAKELADGAFDTLSARDRELLIQAATLKLQPRRKGEDPVRKANTIARLLSRVRGLRAARSPSPQSAIPSISDLVRRV